jgi:hypothetical protein
MHFLLTEKIEKRQYDFFKKQFPNKTETELKKVEKILTILFEKTQNISKQVMKNGFTPDYSNINYKEWLKFISKIIPVIESFKIKSGKEKLDILLMYCVLLVIIILPLHNKIKQIIIDIILEVVPEIVNSVIYVSKKLHSGLRYIIKKLLKRLKYCCVINKEIE